MMPNSKQEKKCQIVNETKNQKCQKCQVALYNTLMWLFFFFIDGDGGDAMEVVNSSSYMVNEVEFEGMEAYGRKYIMASELNTSSVRVDDCDPLTCEPLRTTEVWVVGWLGGWPDQTFFWGGRKARGAPTNNTQRGFASCKLRSTLDVQFAAAAAVAFPDQRAARESGPVPN